MIRAAFSGSPPEKSKSQLKREAVQAEPVSGNTPKPVYEYGYGLPKKNGVPGVRTWRVYQSLEAFINSGYATLSSPLGKTYRREVGAWEEFDPKSAS